MVANFILSLIDATRELQQSLIFVFRIFPSFCLANGLLNLCVRNSVSNILKDINLNITEENGIAPSIKLLNGTNTPPVDLGSPFHLNTVGWSLIFLGIECVVYMIATILLDLVLLRRQQIGYLGGASGQATNGGVDLEDPKNQKIEERQDAYETGSAENGLLVLRSLSKRYPSQKSFAVKNVSLSIEGGGIFGLLGENGAGKSTTLKMLLGELQPTSGDISFRGNSGGQKAQDETHGFSVGYCPQFTSLLEYLTVREHLELFLTLKGVQMSRQRREGRGLLDLEKLLALFNLEEFKHVPAGKLSGGNQRKLQVAIALIGSPELIVLDEPTCGMDIENRRFVWRVLSSLKTSPMFSHSGSTIVLTSHSMEECEFLCSAVAILKRGQLQCSGTIPWLKKVFQQGHLLQVRVKEPSAHAVQKIISSLAHYRDFLQGQFAAENFSIPVVKAPSTTKLVTKERLVELLSAIKLQHFHGDGKQLGFALAVEDIFSSVQAFLEESFSVAPVEKQGLTLKLNVSPANGEKENQLKNLFQVLSRLEQQIRVQSYTLAETTLEDIFLDIAEA